MDASPTQPVHESLSHCENSDSLLILCRDRRHIRPLVFENIVSFTGTTYYINKVVCSQGHTKVIPFKKHVCLLCDFSALNVYFKTTASDIIFTGE